MPPQKHSQTDSAHPCYTMGNATAHHCTVTVHNKSQYTLSGFSHYDKCGKWEKRLPPFIPPKATAEGDHGHPDQTTLGAEGVFTYTLKDASGKAHKKVGVVFSALHNYFAVGIYDVGKSCDGLLYNEMVGPVSPGQGRDARDMGGTQYSSDGVTVSGQMTGTCQLETGPLIALAGLRTNSSEMAPSSTQSMQPNSRHPPSLGLDSRTSVLELPPLPFRALLHNSDPPLPCQPVLATGHSSLATAT
ncbi:uncharacterized protein LOC134464824 [Engraulis encrasicolus]|uniref:uncharacterized protein LOC134464824 n=1 Tax=Engraulis encrasicolus TaxID=184585 RepID=UPI002FCE89EE